MMPSAFHESIWAELPPGLAAPDFELRCAFLLGRVAPGQRVLDLGCGEGDFAAALAAAGTQVVGADVAQEPLLRARRRHPELGDLRLIESDGPWSALEDNAFDVVWAGEVIEHVADTAGWLSEVRRVLRSDGRLLLATPALGRLQLLRAALSASYLAERFDPRSDHLHHYSGRTLSSLLESFGFRQVEVRGAGGPPWSPRLLLASAVRARF